MKDKINELLDKRNKLSEELDKIDNEIEICKNSINPDEFTNKCYMQSYVFGNYLYRIVNATELKDATHVSALVETIYCSSLDSLGGLASLGFSHSMTNYVFDIDGLKEIPLVMFERYKNKAKVIDAAISDFNKDFAE